MPIPTTNINPQLHAACPCHPPVLPAGAHNILKSPMSTTLQRRTSYPIHPAAPPCSGAQRAHAKQQHHSAAAGNMPTSLSNAILQLHATCFIAHQHHPAAVHNMPMSHSCTPLQLHAKHFVAHQHLPAPVHSMHTSHSMRRAALKLHTACLCRPPAPPCSCAQHADVAHQHHPAAAQTCPCHTTVLLCSC